MQFLTNNCNYLCKFMGFLKEDVYLYMSINFSKQSYFITNCIFLKRFREFIKQFINFLGRVVCIAFWVILKSLDAKKAKAYYNFTKVVLKIDRYMSIFTFHFYHLIIISFNFN